MRNFILTRGRYISEGYFYFLSYYSRAYEKLFSDDPARIQFITSLKNVQGSITLKPLSSRIFIYSSFKAKHNLSVKTQFFRLVMSKFHHLYCRAVLRSYSLLFTASKGIIFFLKTSHLNRKDENKMYIYT